ncbi:MAG: CDP-alcohol phosphatidyltransferase family protein [Candidatus Tectimicrobiota bacterium]
MPSIYDLKPRFQRLLRPLMLALAGLGIRPNAVTVAALLGSCLVGYGLLYATTVPALLLLLPVWLLVRMALNAIDGMMARELCMATPLGAVLNELGDVLADIGLYLPFAFLAPPAQWPVLAFVLGAVLTELCGVLGQALAGKRHYEGPMGKSDRACLVSLLAVLAFCLPATLSFWPWSFGGAALLTVVTCWKRLASMLRELQVPPTASAR